MKGTLQGTQIEPLPRILVAPDDVQGARIANLLGPGRVERVSNLAQAAARCVRQVVPPLVLVLDRTACSESLVDFLRSGRAPVVHLREQVDAPIDLPVFPLDDLVVGTGDIEAFLQRAAREWSAAGDTERELYRLTRDAMHELRTSLSTVIGFAALLHDGVAGPLEEAQREYVEHVQAGANDLLDGLEAFHGNLRLQLGAWPDESTRSELGQLWCSVGAEPLPRELEPVPLDGHADQLVRALKLVHARAARPTREMAGETTEDGHRVDVRGTITHGRVELRFRARRTPGSEEQKALAEGGLDDGREVRSVERVCGLGLGLAHRLIARAGGRLTWDLSGDDAWLVVRLPMATLAPLEEAG